ncbi:restriction endonuclease subunit S [Mesorhizobium sp. M0136]|uniref:restriction endonuclease subunit S n=1 Tax=Mesorhizobium sp. M0136 TaxID=2956890 RepID=UPI003337B3EC
MIEGLKPYPDMNPSGLRWLGAVPAHWEIHRAKYSFYEADDRSEQGDEELLSVSHKTGVTPRSQKNITMFMAESYVGHKVCNPGDIVVNTMWAWMAAIGVSRHVGIVSPAYAVYRSRVADRFEPKFLDYLLRTEIYRAEYVRGSRGITTSRLRLYPPDFLNIPFIQPSIDEQRLIARFLDWHGVHTSKLIRAKQKMIALLNEQKQAIIHRAVSAGVDQPSRFITTGNPWFPELPERWQLLPMRRVITRAVDGPHHSPEYQGGGIPFLSARNIRPNEWNLGTEKFISESDYLEFCRRIKPEVGDVLYTKGGTTGVALAVDRDFRFQVWVHIAVLKLREDKIRPKFLALALNSPKCYEQSQLLTRGATNQDLGLGRMKDIVLPVPPLAQQDAIVASIELSVQALDRTMETARSEISFFREYYTRLAADVVTGKLDVRALAAGLPEATDRELLEELGDDEDLEEAFDDAENEEAA